MSVSTTAIFHPLARHVWALVSERLSSRVDSASRRYIYLFIYFYPLARHVWALGSERLFARVDSTSQRYIYIYIYISACSPCLGPGLQTAILCRIHYSALRPHPLSVIFLWPCGLACPLMAKSSILFFLRPLTAKLIFYLPHGGCSFYYSSASSRRYFIRASRR